MQNIELYILFFMGLILSFLSYLGSLLEEDRYKDKAKTIFFTIVLSKALLGGTIAILVFYGLAEVSNLNEFLRTGAAGTAAILTEHSKKIVLAFTNKKLGVKDEL